MTRIRAVRTDDSPEKSRRRALRRLYGITPEDYDRMLEEQAGRCVICQRHESECPTVPAGRPRKDGLPKAVARPFVVDHDHVSGRVRGLLCSRCNTVLGWLGEDVAVFRRAVAYLTGDGPLGSTP